LFSAYEERGIKTGEQFIAGVVDSGDKIVVKIRKKYSGAQRN
jgi:hypothetical protein